MNKEKFSININGVTNVTIQMDMNDQWKEFFNGVWPKALAILKELAEAK